MVPFTPPQIPFAGRFHSGLLGPDGRPLQPWLTPDTPGADGFRGDGFALPHVYQFSAILSGAQKTYFHDRWDEARKNSRENAQAMERDAFLQGLLQERKLATATLKWHIEVDDEKDPYQKALKDGLQRILADTPYLIRHHYACLDAIWYGRHGVQRKYDWKEIDLPSVNFQPSVPGIPGTLATAAIAPSSTQQAGPGIAQSGPGIAVNGAPAVVTSRTQRRRCQVVTKHQPVHGDSIGHKWDGTPYVLLYSPEAKLYQQQGAEITLTTAGSYGLVLRDAFWRDRFILHTQESVAAEFFDPERAEAIHGCGVRDRLYWLDWLKREFLEWVVSFFERVGLGVTIWYYEAGNNASFEEVQKAAQDQSRRANILVPQYPARVGPGVGGIERLETPVAGAEAMLGMIKHLEEIQERFLVGQSASSRSDAKGLGTHDTSFQRDTKYQLIKYDADNLSDTYTCQWLEPVQRSTFPEWASIPARFRLNVPDPEAEQKLEAVSKAISFGVEFKKDELRGLTGLSDPEPGDDVVGGQAMMAMSRDGDNDGIINEKNNPGESERGRPGATPPPSGDSPGKAGQFGSQGVMPPTGGPRRQQRSVDPKEPG